MFNIYDDIVSNDESKSVLPFLENNNGPLIKNRTFNSIWLNDVFF